MKFRMKKGFTLAELLIVVAIIAVLVAVAIPVFSAQIEKAAEATDLANIRSAYASVTVEAISGETSIAPVTVPLKQTKSGWTTPTAQNTLNDITKNHVVGAPADGSGNTATVEWLSDAEAVKVTFNGGASGGGSGSGGSGESGGGTGGDSSGAPAIHSTGGGSFTRGTVLQDETGTCVIKSGMYGTQTAWNNGSGKSVSELIAEHPDDALSVNPANIKDASSESIAAGDIFFDAGSGTYYYVTSFNQYEGLPNTAWFALLQ